jgi:bifunctional DNA-binding transcriptional regulator/antitoxin component of YhaV-PrlF toxin-antitoxin module
MNASYKLAVDRQGRVVLPVDLRKELGVDGGGQVTVAIDGGVVHLDSRRLAIRRMQRELRELLPEGVSLSEELIADRRAEARRENGE